VSPLIDYLRDTETITVETTEADGRTHRTPIWAVETRGSAYIRSSHGTSSAWYRRATAAGGLAVVTSHGLVPVTLTEVGDVATRDAVDRAYRMKYANQPQYLRMLVGPDARVTTMSVQSTDPVR